MVLKCILYFGSHLSMAVNEATYIVQHEVHPHWNNSSPSPLLFLPSHVSQGVSKKGLACVPLVSKGHFDPGSLLLQKTLCGSVQPVLKSLQRSTTIASGCCSPFCPRVDADPLVKTSQSSQEQTVMLNVTFLVQPQVKRKGTYTKIIL